MDIPFETFCTLIYRLSHPPKPRPTASNPSPSPLPPSKIFASFLAHLPKPLPPSSGKHLFRLLFPHEGSRRRYGLKETKLARELEAILGSKGLGRWDGVCWENGGDGGTGCLGKEVEVLMRKRIPPGTKSTLSIRELDHLLDLLAYPSPFSQLSQPPPHTPPFPSQTQFLTQLYARSDLSPYALAVLTQLILRDLRPLLNPLPKLSVRNPTALLRMKSNTGPAQLELREAMACWDRRMPGIYEGGVGDLGRVCAMIEDMGGGPGETGAESSEMGRSSRGPVIGVNVPIPKCRKGRSIDDALNEFTGSPYAPPARSVWAETKYDGYRMQVHVNLGHSEHPIITVFSKSKRDSTQDRINTHSIVLAALGLPVQPDLPCHTSLTSRLVDAAPPRRPMQRSIILEAEVVPYNEGEREGGRGPGIEEFWWLGAAGVSPDDDFRGYQPFGANRSRHLCLAFFDVLYLDGEDLLRSRYERRRDILKQVVREIPGFSILAERTKIPLHLGRSRAVEALQDAFARSNVNREEGLVLKAGESSHSRMKHRWVKLKKDYIPNLGDCVDLVLLGAGWDLDRARELRVDTSVYTTFYLGVLLNGAQVRARTETPHFEILFRASYGLDRSQLEVYNENIRLGRWRSKPFDRDDPFKRRLLGLSWTYKLQQGMKPPSVLFETPLCAEVMGAGFQRLPGSELYEIRWPRLQKIHNPSDRSWVEALDAHSLLSAAHKSLGYRTPACPLPISPQDDSIRNAWRSSSTMALTDVPDFGNTPSPGVARPSPRRGASEPDLREIGKTSPPTPGVMRRRFVDVLQEREDEASVRGGWAIVTPTAASPQSRKRLGSPMMERGAGPRHSKRAKAETLFGPLVSPTPRLAPSPLIRDLVAMRDARAKAGGPGVGEMRQKFSGIMVRELLKGKVVRPLSLRTRIKLAERGLSRVSVAA